MSTSSISNRALSEMLYSARGMPCSATELSAMKSQMQQDLQTYRRNTCIDPRPFCIFPSLCRVDRYDTVYDHIWFCSPFPKRGRKGETRTFRIQASIPASHLCSFHDQNMHNREMAKATVLQFQSTLKAAMCHGKRY